MAEVALSRLTHDVVQNTYKELLALLDSLSDAPADEKRQRFLDFLLTSRHRFARLLVSVRWFMSYSAFHSSAQVTHNMALTRSQTYTYDADRLHEIRGISHFAAALPPALPQAAEILGASRFFNRLPRIIENSIGLDLAHSHSKSARNPPPANSSTIDAKHPPADQSGDSSSSVDEDITKEAVERLTVTARRVITDCLPSGVSIIQPDNNQPSLPLRVGVPDVWSADIFLTSLKETEAQIIVHAIQLCVDGHPDVPTVIRSTRRSMERPVPLRTVNQYELRNYLNQRIQLRLGLVPPESTFDQRMKLSLRSLSLATSVECCGALVMSHVRAQGVAMMNSLRWRVAGLNIEGRFADPKKKQPIYMSYWPKSHLRASVTFRTLKSVDESDPEKSAAAIQRVIDIRHEPALPARNANVTLRVASIDLQKLLITSGRLRAVHELESIIARCRTYFDDCVSLKIVPRGPTSIALAVNFNGGDACLVIGFSLMSGGIFAAVYGLIQSLLSQKRELGEGLNNSLWTGERFFKKGTDGVWAVVKVLVNECKTLVELYARMRSVWASGGGAMMGWPPGQANVERPTMRVGETTKRINAPLAMIERKRPRSFMTLGSVACDSEDWMVGGENGERKRAKGQNGAGLNFCVSDELLFFEARASNGLMSPSEYEGGGNSGRGMAALAELRHDVDWRVRRDALLNVLLKHNIIMSWTHEGGGDKVYEANVQLRMMPIVIEKAVVRVLGEGGWRLRLTLKEDIFADTRFAHGLESSYYAKRRILDFCYMTMSKTDMRSCAREVMRARTAATIASGLKGPNKDFKVLEQTHRQVMVEAHGLLLNVGLGMTGIEIDTWPVNEFLRVKLLPLVEELLGESRKDMGKVFNGLLRLSLPMGLQLEQVMAVDGIVKHVKFLTVLRARMVMVVKQKDGKVAYGLDVDLRKADGSVVLSDAERVRKLKAASLGHPGNSGSEGGSGGMDLLVIPIWETILSKMVSKGFAKAMNERSGMQIDLQLLAKVMIPITRSMTR